MNRDDVRKLAARTSAQASAIARGRQARPAAPASAAKPAEPARPGPVPPKTHQRPNLTVLTPKARQPRFTPEAVAAARRRRPSTEPVVDHLVADRLRTLLKAYEPAPGVLPKGQKVAMDSALQGAMDWGGGWFVQGGWFEGQTFLGYPILAEMAQRPEYRKACERLSTEVTRKWIEIVSLGGDDDKTDRIKEIDDFLKDIKLREAAQQAVFMDAAMGRSHWYLDTGDTDDPAELGKPVGDGRNKFSTGKIGKEKPLKRILTIDPTWTYPSQYNANDPLKPDWLKPDSWFVMAKQVHMSRLLTFVGRPVPDLFKPSFNFGGLALTQMMKPFVDNWTSVRQHVAKIVANFSKNGILTDLMQQLAPSDGSQPSQGAIDDLFRRIDFYNALSDNNGTLVLNKGTEEFFQYNTPLGTLDQLLSQFLEQILLPAGMPLVIYLGLTPHGLNASSEGEILAWESWVHAYQPHFFGDTIQRVIDFAQLSLYGDVDPEIGYRWIPLRSMTEKEVAELNKSKADTFAIYADRGTLDPLEERRRLAGDPQSGYNSIDAEDVPELPDDGEGEGEEGDGPEDTAGKVTGGDGEAAGGETVET